MLRLPPHVPVRHLSRPAINAAHPEPWPARPPHRTFRRPPRALPLASKRFIGNTNAVPPEGSRSVRDSSHWPARALRVRNSPVLRDTGWEHRDALVATRQVGWTSQVADLQNPRVASRSPPSKRIDHTFPPVRRHTEPGTTRCSTYFWWTTRQTFGCRLARP